MSDILDDGYEFRRVSKPVEREKVWGSEMVIADTKLYAGKMLKLAPEARTSTHMHNFITETLYCMGGKFLLYLDGVWIPIEDGQVITIPRGSWHSLLSARDEYTFIIEIASGYRSDDIVRRDKSKVMTNEEAAKAIKIWEATFKAAAGGHSPA